MNEPSASASRPNGVPANEKHAKGSASAGSAVSPVIPREADGLFGFTQDDLDLLAERTHCDVSVTDGPVTMGERVVAEARPDVVHIVFVREGVVYVVIPMSKDYPHMRQGIEQISRLANQALAELRRRPR